MMGSSNFAIKGGRMKQSKQSVFTTIVVMTAFFMLAGCGGGGGSSTTATATPAGTIVDENGNSVPSVNIGGAVNVSLTGLSKNTRYALDVTDASGRTLSPSSGFTLTSNEDGAIPSTTIAQDLTTPVGNADMSSAPAGDMTTKQVTGNYNVCVREVGGTTCLATVSFGVTDTDRASCVDSTGAAKSSFTNTESLFVKLDKGAAGTLADGTYTCYIIQDLVALSDGDTIIGSAFNVTVASGTGTSAAISLATTGAGAFDVLCDVNGNGKYNRGTDILSRPGRFRPCFTLQQAHTGADIVAQVCADEKGNYRDIFDPDATDSDIRDVWAYISPPQRLATLDHRLACKWVVAHKATWTTGDRLVDVDDAEELDPVQVGCSNESPVLVWPRQRLVAGCYDCIIDIDCNGQYDAGVDFLDNIDSANSNSVGGMCVANSACGSNITITSNTDGQSVSTTAITLAGTVTGSPTSGKVTIVQGDQSNTVQLSVASGTFSASIPLFNGANKLTVFVYQSDGTICAKTITITSTAAGSANQLFRAQLTWDGSTDMDLHLVKPGGTYSNGGGGSGDCNYSNCKVGLAGTDTNSIDWGVAGEDDDPKLDVDCVSCGNGIENIWMNQITDNGAYKVYVDAFSGSEDPVTITIFIRGNTVATVSCGAMSSGTTTDSCFVGTISWAGGSSGSGTFAPSGTKASNF